MISMTSSSGCGRHAKRRPSHTCRQRCTEHGSEASGSTTESEQRSQPRSDIGRNGRNRQRSSSFEGSLILSQVRSSRSADRLRPPAPLEIPSLPSRFKPRKYLARTPYGEVVEAFNHDRGISVALKLLHADGTHADVARAMFRREVEALKGLSHDAIVQILDSFECEDNLLVIELELVPGGLSLRPLFEEVRTGRRARPTLEWRIRMAEKLAEAVSEAHRRHVIHRDIKPGNVLWNRDEDSLKLADFGIAAVLPLTVREQPGVTGKIS